MGFTALNRNHNLVEFKSKFSKMRTHVQPNNHIAFQRPFIIANRKIVSMKINISFRTFVDAYYTGFQQ